MNISKEKVDRLNLVLKVDVKRGDYINEVEKELKSYSKRAKVSGFRKGHVPIGLLKKQYGNAVISDKVNKMVQTEISKFIKEEGINHLGYPIPKEQDGFTWEEKDFHFEFDLGLMPLFRLKLNPKNITYYEIKVTDEELEKQIDTLRKHYGSYVDGEAWKSDDNLICANIKGKGIDQKDTRFTLAELNDGVVGKIKTLKKGDSVGVNATKFLKDENRLLGLLGVSKGVLDSTETLEVEITAFKNIVLSELNQDFYDRVFGKDKVTSEESFRKLVKEQLKVNYQRYAENQFQNDFMEALIEKTSFKLPKDFLVKWIRFSGEKVLTEADAEEQFKNAEQSIRYQLIENKIIEDYKISTDPKELELFIKNRVKLQLESYGQFDPQPDYLEQITSRILDNEKQIKSYRDEFLVMQINKLFKNEGGYKKKEITYEEYIETIGKEKDKKTKKTKGFLNGLRKRI
ncbi:trigger factor [Elysia marginata]|uniref:Trigger factor n=1 Tax=Elysia marginata TaxID=1093978 RepID=A0AAV4FH83_9GAST|nr:trigger factor [Elysia marginata]